MEYYFFPFLFVFFIFFFFFNKEYYFSIPLSDIFQRPGVKKAS